MSNFNIKKFFKLQYLAESYNAINENIESKVKEYHSYLLKISDPRTAGTPEQHLQGVKNLDGDFDKYLQNEIDYFDLFGNEEIVNAIEKFRKGDMNENDDVQAKVNAASKVKSKGGAEKKQARKGYGDKPNKAGRGKEMKRKMNKRNRKDAKQALKDA